VSCKSLFVNFNLQYGIPNFTLAIGTRRYAECSKGLCLNYAKNR
jgi:hypothetical protein